MTNLVLTFIFSLFAFMSFSQDMVVDDTSIVQAMNDPVRSDLFKGTLESPNLNVLFRGVNNYIISSVENSDGRPIRLYGSGCSISLKPGSSDQYIVRPGRSDSAIIALAIKSEERTIPVRRKVYRVVSLPDPDLHWGKARSGRSLDTKSRTLSAGYTKGIVLDASFSVVSWIMNYNGESMSGEGNDLSSADSLIKDIESGSTLTIDAMVKGPDGIARPLSGVWMID